MGKLFLAVSVAAFFCFRVSAQNSNLASDLIKEGVDLHNQSKYTEAIVKYAEALKIEPENSYANYEMAFSLYASKKFTEAIPFLEKAVNATNKSVSVGAYCLLASIYDDGNQAQKAIDTYNAAIKIDPNYPQIFYNLGLAYFRNKQYLESENSAVEAMKHNPKSASSQRLYALVCFHQNKRGNALAALCTFLMLEPTGLRAAEAFTNIQRILKGGVLRDPNGKMTIQVSAADDKETGSLNMTISIVAAEAQTPKLTGIDLLEEQFKNIFSIYGQLAEKKTDKTFFDKFFAEYLYKLVQSGNLPAFTRTASLSAFHDENAKWLKDNPGKLHDLAEWIAKTERGF